MSHDRPPTLELVSFGDDAPAACHQVAGLYHHQTRSRGKYGEPLYFNKLARLWLYQRCRDEWAIGAICGAPTCIARKQGPELLGRGFSVLAAQHYEGQRAKWVELGEQLECFEARASERVADAVAVRVRGGATELCGLYERLPRSLVYWNAEAKRYLWLDGESWQICTSTAAVSAQA